MKSFTRERGYGRIDTDDESTLMCICGASFTWTAFDERLATWLALHGQHTQPEAQTP